MNRISIACIGFATSALGILFTLNPLFAILQFVCGAWIGVEVWKYVTGDAE